MVGGLCGTRGSESETETLQKQRKRMGRRVGLTKPVVFMYFTGKQPRLIQMK